MDFSGFVLLGGMEEQLFMNQWPISVYGYYRAAFQQKWIFWITKTSAAKETCHESFDHLCHKSLRINYFPWRFRVGQWQNSRQRLASRPCWNPRNIRAAVFQRRLQIGRPFQWQTGCRLRQPLGARSVDPERQNFRVFFRQQINPLRGTTSRYPGNKNNQS